MIVGEEEILIKSILSVLMKNNLGNIKECRTLINHGHVYVNGSCLDDIYYMVNCDDIIVVNGEPINSSPFVYYMLNKPKGYLSASYDKDNLCIKDIIKRDDCHCVGRLDRDTTGLLLVTNDKSLSKKLLLPNQHIPKKYLVSTELSIDKEMVLAFKEGVIIDGNVRCQSAVLEILDNNHCYVTVCEGKYHQIKKMFLSCGNKVVELKRIEFAGIVLDSALQAGEYRELDHSEMNILWKRG